MSLETLKTRINFNGGEPQVSRMNVDKLKSLKKALIYSYQSATAILEDGREFRCLINPDKLKNEYDNKIISIPFEDICLNKEKKGTTTDGIEEIGMAPGQVFTWKENNTDWIVFLQRLEETAYFRAEIRRCKYETEINGITYKVYAGKHSLDKIDWLDEKGLLWNDLDYTLEMYITKDENTETNLNRFDVIKLNGQPWEVQATDSISSDGIIMVALKEYYKNTIEEKIEEEKEDAKEIIIPDEDEAIIIGETLIYPYDERTYRIENAEGGIWSVSNSKVEITAQDDAQVQIYVKTSRSGNFNLIYSRENEEDIVLPITIDSL